MKPLRFQGYTKIVFKISSLSKALKKITWYSVANYNCIWKQIFYRGIFKSSQKFCFEHQKQKQNKKNLKIVSSPLLTTNNIKFLLMRSDRLTVLTFCALEIKTHVRQWDTTRLHCFLPFLILSYDYKAIANPHNVLPYLLDLQLNTFANNSFLTCIADISFPNFSFSGNFFVLLIMPH